MSTQVMVRMPVPMHVALKRMAAENERTMAQEVRFHLRAAIVANGGFLPEVEP